MSIYWANKGPEHFSFIMSCEMFSFIMSCEMDMYYSNRHVAAVFVFVWVLDGSSKQVFMCSVLLMHLAVYE